MFNFELEEEPVSGELIDNEKELGEKFFVELCLNMIKEGRNSLSDTKSVLIGVLGLGIIADPENVKIALGHLLIGERIPHDILLRIASHSTEVILRAKGIKK